MKAAAASPALRSVSPRGGPWRLSAMTTSTWRALPAATASRAVLRAVVPARRVLARSAAKMSGRKSRAAAMMAAHCFSA